MKSLVLIFFLPVWVFAQVEEEYPFLHSLEQSSLLTQNTSLLTTPFPALDQLLTRLEAKQNRFKTQKEFLAFIFTQTHQRLLKSYEDNSSYEQLIDRGAYNCLTATTVYALLMEHFKFNYSIVETNYHIFLMVNTRSGQVLLETTDPLNGFVDRAEDIQNRVVTYQENKALTATREDQYYFSFSLYRSVTLKELEGLLYYNESVRAFNETQFDVAIRSLKRAYATYYSERVEEFSKVLLLSIASNQHLALSERASYVKQLQQIRKSRVNASVSK